jgi:hypothetical protein
METPVSNEQIMALMGQQLAKYKALAGGIVRIKSIPRNPSGKILKRILRERATKELRGDDLSDDALTINTANTFAVQSMSDLERPMVKIVG